MFLLSDDSSMLVVLKLSKQGFNDTGVDLVVGGGIPYGRSVSDDIDEIIIKRIKGHDDNFGGEICGELVPITSVS